MPKRFNLVIANDLFNAVQAVADERGVTVTEVIRQFMKLGLLAAAIEKEPGSELVIREGGQERVLVLM